MQSALEIVYKCGHRVEGARIFRTKEIFGGVDDMWEIFIYLGPRATPSTDPTGIYLSPIQKEWELLAWINGYAQAGEQKAELINLLHDEIVVRGFTEECEAVLAQTSLRDLRQGGEALTVDCQYCFQRAEANKSRLMRSGGGNEVQQTETQMQRLDLEENKKEQWEIDAERHEKAYEESRKER